MQVRNIYLGCLTPLVLIAVSTAQAQIVTVPTFEGGFFTASVGTWYATPSAENEAYGVQHTDDSTSILNITPDYHFGALASVSYMFRETANDIELSYVHFNSSDSDSIDNPTEAHRLHSTLKYELDSLDLMISQFINLGRHMQVRFSAGLAYVELEQQQNNYLHEEDAFGKTDLLDQRNEYMGWGPRLAIDSRYDFGQGFGIIGGGSVAYFTGDLDVTTTQNNEMNSTTNDLDDHAITNLRGNLGVDYIYYFNNDDRSTIGLELGYQADYYADAISTLETIDGTDIDSLSLTFSGPYLNIKAKL